MCSDGLLGRVGGCTMIADFEAWMAAAFRWRARFPRRRGVLTAGKESCCAAAWTASVLAVRGACEQRLDTLEQMLCLAGGVLFGACRETRRRDEADIASIVSPRAREDRWWCFGVICPGLVITDN